MQACIKLVMRNQFIMIHRPVTGQSPSLSTIFVAHHNKLTPRSPECKVATASTSLTLPEIEEAPNHVVSCIQGRFDQPGYTVLRKLEDLLLKAAKSECFDQELESVMQQYKNPFTLEA